MTHERLTRIREFADSDSSKRGETIRDLLQHIDMERAQAEKMRRALVKYADKKNWGHRYSQSYTDEPFDWWLEEGPGYQLARQSLEQEHEPGCPAIADDESDEVLTDYQQCVCKMREKP